MLRPSLAVSASVTVTVESTTLTETRGDSGGHVARIEDLETRRSERLRLGVLAGITLIGLLARLPGLGAHGLYYDDAWFALSSRVDLGSALHFSVTTPGFTLIEALWIRVLPHSDTWAQLLPWILAVAAPPIAYALGRVLRLTGYASLAMAAVVAISPAAIEYSVRVKEYQADFVLAAALLILVERTRRTERTTLRLAVLAVLSIISVFISASTAAVVIGAWIGLGVCAFVDQRRRCAVLVWAAGILIVTIAMTLVITSAASVSLTSFWQWQDRLFGTPYSWSHLRTAVGLSSAGLFHGLVGSPLPQVAATTLMTLLLIGGLLLFVWLAWPAATAALHRDGEADDLRLLPATFVVAIAVLLFLAGKVPLGTGRTDLVLYPALLLLLARGLERLVRAGRRILRPTLARIAVFAVLVGALVLGLSVAWQNRAWYPSQDVVSVQRQLRTAEQPSDWTVVGYRNSFTWAYAGLSPWIVHHSRTNGAASTIGFWVTFDRSRDLAQLNGLYLAGPIPGLNGIPTSVKRMWFVGVTQAVVSPSEVHPTGSLSTEPIDLPTVALQSYGWVPTPTRLHGDGVYAQLYVRSGSRP
jgi:hypothetical protein